MIWTYLSIAMLAFGLGFSTHTAIMNSKWEELEKATGTAKQLISRALEREEHLNHVIKEGKKAFCSEQIAEWRDF